MLIYNNRKFQHTDDCLDIIEHNGVRGMKWGVRRRLSDNARRRIRNVTIGAVGVGALAGAGYLAYKKGLFVKKSIPNINKQKIVPLKTPIPSVKSPYPNKPIVPPTIKQPTIKQPTIKQPTIKQPTIKPPTIKPQQYDYEAYRRSIVSKDMKAFHDTYDEYKKAVENLRSTAEKLNAKPVKKKRLRNIAKRMFN